MIKKSATIQDMSCIPASALTAQEIATLQAMQSQGFVLYRKKDTLRRKEGKRGYHYVSLSYHAALPSQASAYDLLKVTDWKQLSDLPCSK